MAFFFFEGKHKAEDDKRGGRNKMVIRNQQALELTRPDHQPIELTPHLFQLGTPSFPVYLSVGDESMLIEGGTGATFAIIVNQLRYLGVEPETLKYIVLTHTHHIGAVPHFQRAWPHIKLLASHIGKRTLAKTELFKQFNLVDLGIAQ